MLTRGHRMCLLWFLSDFVNNHSAFEEICHINQLEASLQKNYRKDVCS